MTPTRCGFTPITAVATSGAIRNATLLRLSLTLRIVPRCPAGAASEISAPSDGRSSPLPSAHSTTHANSASVVLMKYTAPYAATAQHSPAIASRPSP